MNNNTKVVTIDFWNTIFDSSGGSLRNNYRHKALVEEIDKLGVMVKHDRFSAALQASWEYFNRIWKNDMRTPLPDETVQFFWTFLDLPDEKAAKSKVVEAFADSVLVHPPNLIDGVENALSLLSKKYKLAIISDTGFSPGTVLREMLKNADIFKYFSSFSFSDETGVSKPHPKAFQTVLNDFNCDAQSAVHIGDIENTDVKGAIGMGMRSIMFTGDPTALFHGDNPPVSKAEKQFSTWDEIHNYLLD